jgi:hypothetical protein
MNNGGSFMRNRILLVLVMFGLAACGGGGDGSESAASRYQQAVDQANAMEATSRNLGVPTPCQQNSQCGVLTFLEPTRCPTQTYLVYSTASPSATAASAAAGQQVTLAQQAIALDPAPPQPCPLSPVRAPPLPVCMTGVCQAAPLL